MPTSANTELNALVDQFLRRCEENNLTVGQATDLIGGGTPGKKIRNIFETWRRGGHVKLAFAHTHAAIESGLKAIEANKIPAIPEKGRPSQLIRRKGPALFTNGKYLYKAGHLTGKGPRLLYRVDPETGKAHNWKEQLGTTLVEAEATPRQRRAKGHSHGASPAKRQRGPRYSAGVARKRAIPLAPQIAEAAIPAPAPLPTSVDGLIELRQRLKAASAQLEQRIALVEDALNSAIERIQDALTKPPRPPSSKRSEVSEPFYGDNGEPDDAEEIQLDLWGGFHSGTTPHTS